MSEDGLLSDEVRALARAAGLLNDAGGFDGSWFDDPIGRLGSVLSDGGQRAALAELLRLVLPGAGGDPTLHPVVSGTVGDAGLSLRGDGKASLVVGIYARATLGDGATLEVDLPLVVAEDGKPVALSTERAEHPLRLALRAPVTGEVAGVRLDALRAELRLPLSGGDPQVAATLENLVLGGAPPADRSLRLDRLDQDVPVLVLALLRTQGAAVGAILDLLGFGAGSIPPLPLGALATRPDLLRSWLGDVLATHGDAWIAALASALGAAVRAGSGASRWRIGLPTPVADVDLVLAHVGGAVELGIALARDEGALRVEAGATLARVPLVGDPGVVLLSQARVTLSSSGTALLTSPVRVGRLAAGLRWTGGALAPLVELHDVVSPLGTWPVLDLANLDSVASAAASKLLDDLLAALGTGPEVEALAVIACLKPPAADPASPLVDVATLATDPLAAILTAHGAALGRPAGWSHHLAAVARLFGVTVATTGSGTEATPWRAELARTEAVGVGLVAWNDGGALRWGVDLTVVLPELELHAAAALVRADAATISLDPRASLRLAFLPGFDIDPAGPFDVSAARLAVHLAWNGSSVERDLALTGLRRRGGSPTALGPLQLTKLSTGFQPANLGATATALGLPGPDALVDLLREVVLAALSRWGGAGATLVGLATGLDRRASNAALPPLLTAGFLRDPLAGVVDWLQSLAVGGGMADLAGQVGRLLLGMDTARARELGRALPAGCGTSARPWVLPAADAELLVWLDPDGPGLPVAGTGVEPAEVGRGLHALAGHVPALAPLADAWEPGTFGMALRGLDAWFTTSDGVVPAASACPSPAPTGWTVEALPGVVHGTYGKAASARIAAAVTAAGPGPVLYVSPPGAAPGGWASLPPGTPTVELDVPGVAPDAVDLSALAAAPAWIVRLGFGDRTLAGLVAQLERVAVQAKLRSGVAPVLVGEGVAGSAAHAVAAKPGLVRALVTLGTPHLPSSDPGPSYADDLRRLLPAAVGMAPGPVRAGLELVGSRLDGLAPGGGPRPQADPAEWFAGVPAASLPVGVPVLALGSTLGSVTDAVAGALPAIRAAAPTRRTPTALRTALRMERRYRVGPVLVRVRLATAALRLGLGSAPGIEATGGLSATIHLSRPGGWLVGGAGPTPTGRALSAEVGLEVLPGGAGGTWKARVRVEQAGHLGPTVPVLDESGDPAVLRALLGAAFGALAADATSPVVKDLRALGLLLPDRVEASLDAFQAFLVDPRGYLSPRLAGFASTVLPAFSGELEAVAEAGGLAVRTRGDGVALGRLGKLRAEARFGPTPSARIELDLDRLALIAAPGRLSVRARPFVEELVLLPAPPAAEREALLARLWPGILLSVAGDAVLAPWGRPALPLSLLVDGGAGVRAFLPATPPDAGLVVDRTNALLARLGDTLGLDPAPGADPRTGLWLPGGLLLEAALDDDAVAVRLRSPARVGGMLLALGVRVDGRLRVEPTGTLSLRVPAGGGRELQVSAGFTSAGPSLQVQPPGFAEPLVLLPRFGGLGPLRGAATSLLLQVLDDALPSPATSDAGKAVQSAAAALGLCAPPPAAPAFAAREAAFRALLAGVLPTSALGTALGHLAAQLGGATRVGDELVWRRSPLEVRVGAVAGALGLRVGITELVLATGVTLDAQAGVLVSGTTPSLTGTGALRIAPAAVAPLAAVVGLGEGPSVRLGLAAGAASLVDLQILPAPLLTVAPVERIALDLALPLLLGLAGRIAAERAGTPLWPAVGPLAAGPTFGAVAEGAGLWVPGPPARFPAPPPVEAVLLGALAKVPVELQLDDVRLKLACSAAGELALTLRGHVAIPAGDLVVRVLFGGGAGTDTAGTTVTLTLPGSGRTVTVGFDADGLGIGLEGADGTPLLGGDVIRIGGLDAFVHVQSGRGLTGAGAQLRGFGIPLGKATASGGNPVAAGLLRGGGGSSGGSAQPALDLAVTWDELDTPRFQVLLNGTLGPLWIGVRSQFGPLYVEQVGFGLVTGNAPAVELLVDCSVNLAGLTVALDDLTVAVPLTTAGDLSTWKLDLAGLALGYSAPGVTLAGGLARVSERGEPAEYAGMLLVKVGTFGLVAVGAWSQPQDEAGGYPSFFAFAGLFVVIGVPPLLEVRGIGLGFGVNRRLLVPEDIRRVPDFILVAALDDADRLTNDPLGVLRQVRTNVPARRGAYWFAAGIHGTMCSLIHVTAVLYVAIDSGLEIGLLGVGRMDLPSADLAIARIELALKVRFSSAEMVLSVQAQLTDNSWIICRDCRLTGGFAFVIWFRTGEFVLSVGGYHPAFARPAHFPDVPRLGFCWAPFGIMSIKGETYFALTNSAAMFGARLEVQYGPDWMNVWFKAWVDALLSWDPVWFSLDLGVSIGARLSIEVDLWFATIRISVSLSVGAQLHLEGPPFRGFVRVELGFFTIEVPFGEDGEEPPALSWKEFSKKYLLGDGASSTPVSARPMTGLLPPEPPGGEPAPGTAASPWRFSAEFSLLTETRLPVTRVAAPIPVPGEAGPVDLAPMRLPDVEPVHTLTIERKVGSAWVGMVAAAEGTTVADLRSSPGDELLLHPSLVRITPRREQFPVATYDYVKGQKPRATSETVSFIAGVEVACACVPVGRPSTIDVVHLVDDSNPRPLPFAQHAEERLGRLRAYGHAAKLLAQGIGPLSGTGWVAALASPLLASARVAAGLRGGPLSPLAQRVERTRSAPPTVRALTAGQTLAPPAPLAARRVIRQESLQWRRAGAPVVQGRIRLPARVADHVAAPLRTRVGPLVGVPRIEAPRAPSVPGALLLRAPAPRAEVRTAAAGGRDGLPARRSVARAGQAHDPALEAGEGRTWTLTGRERRVEVHGAPAWVVMFQRGGAVARAQVALGGRSVAVPPGTHDVVVLALGSSPARLATRGWDLHSLLLPVRPGLWLAPGAALTVVGGEAASPVPTEAGGVVGRAGRVETTFTGAARTLVVVLEPDGGGRGVPRVAVAGATLGEGEGLHLDGRQLWIFPVAWRKPPWRVAVQAPAGWRLAGVLAFTLGPARIEDRLRRHGLPRVPRPQASGRGSRVVFVTPEGRTDD